MTETKLREKIIKEIIDIPLAGVNQVFEEKGLLFRFRKGWLDSVAYNLEFLFKQQIKEIIGEDEKYIKELPITEEIINCNDAIGYRNVLRKEQRKKAGIK